MIIGKENILNEIGKRRISAIIRTNQKKIASEAMQAAIAGGFRIVEFTLTTPGALQLISTFSSSYDDLIVGAGTVLTPQLARDAVKAGSQFLVSPICDPEVIDIAKTLDVVSIPGTFTATEMELAHRHGADLVKLFPAPANIVEYISCLLGPLPFLKIFPTAGVNYENMIDVLNAGAAGIGFTVSLFKPEDIKQKNYASIERRARKITDRLAEIV